MLTHFEHHEPPRTRRLHTCCHGECFRLRVTVTLGACHALSPAGSTSKQQQLQDDLREQSEANKQLQSKAETAQEAAQQAQQQLWQLEQSNAQLLQQTSKQAAEAESLKGELAGLREHEVRLREHVAAQQEQVCGHASTCKKRSAAESSSP